MGFESQNIRFSYKTLSLRVMKNRAAIIICDVFPPESGGVASTAGRLAKYLHFVDIPPCIIVLKPDLTRVLFRDSEITYPTLTLYTSFDRHAECTDAISQIIPDNIEPMFCISLFMGRPAYMGHKLSKFIKVPHYVVCLGSDINKDFDGLSRKWRFEKIIKKAKGIGVLSPDMVEKLCGFPGARNKITFLPAGFDYDIFKPETSPIRYDFLFVGRAKPIKGLDRFLKALSKVATSANVCLVIPHIPSDAEFYDMCRNIASRETTHHYIEWLSDQTPQQLHCLYNASRFIVVPSRNEGAPHVVLEAMGCNRPVIASNVGRISDFLRYNDLVFNSEEEFILLLNRALENDLTFPDNLRFRAIESANNLKEMESYRRFVSI